MDRVRRLIFCGLICLFVVLTVPGVASADPPDCPVATQVVQTGGSVSQPYTSNAHAVDLLPCQTVSIKFTMSVGSTNPNVTGFVGLLVQFWGTFPNGTDNLLFGTSVECSGQCSPTLPVPGGANYSSPYPGTRGAEGLVKKVTVKPVSFGPNTVVPASYFLTITKKNRRFYNSGGIGLSDASQIGFGAKLFGSLDHAEPGQFYKINNPSLTPIRIRGAIACPVGYYNPSLNIQMYKSDGSTIYGLGVQAAGCMGSSGSGSVDMTFTPQAGAPTVLYIKLKAGAYKISDFQLTVEGDPQRTVLLRGSVGSGALSPAPGQMLPTTAYVPQGAVVTFRAVNGLGNPVSAAFTNVTNEKAPGITADGLFPDRVLVTFANRDANTVSMLAAHRGTATVTMAPTDSTLGVRIFTVVIEAPAALGSTDPERDPLVNSVGHALGVPAHFIKAHIAAEGGSNPLAYRYEPIGSIGDLLTISRGESFNYRRTNPRYIPYRLETVADDDSPALAEGTSTNAEDRAVRNGLRVDCSEDGSGGRELGLADTGPISAAMLLRCNDAEMNWVKEAQGEGRDRMRQVFNSDFSAQTSLASSFGYLQVTYIDAMDGSPRWQGVNGLHNPTFLFDTQANIDAGGGTIGLGTFKIVAKFKRLHAANLQDGGFADYDAFVNAFKLAWAAYNSKKKGYADGIARRLSSFTPIASRNLF